MFKNEKGQIKYIIFVFRLSTEKFLFNRMPCRTENKSYHQRAQQKKEEDL